VIPLEYRLREGVRVEEGPGGAWRVVSELPLAVLSINHAAARLLELTRPGIPVADLAAALGLPEEKILLLCERLRRREVLEVTPVAAARDFEPSVTIIIPTRDRAGDLADCLDALGPLDYPRERLDVIVVDDASLEPGAVAEVAARYGARLLVNEQNHGPAYSRNRAAREARGELLAFVDSDCVAGESWLRELVGYFAWPRVAAVGGRTLGYYTESPLDRYEEVASSLDIGAHLRMEAGGSDTFYVPTCNLLVRRVVYAELGGLREDQRVGEDVDFCWRLRGVGHYLVYTPQGVVRHKHRANLAAMMRQRASYGTSEARLYDQHRDKRKRLPVRPAPLATAALVSTALAARKPRLAAAGLAPLALDIARRMSNLNDHGVDMPVERVAFSVLRAHLSMLYFVYFHLVRYYLAPLAVAGLAAPGAWLLMSVAVLYAAAVDYAVKKPRLSFPEFLGYYLAEHGAYQVGVALGCLRAGTWRSYRVGRAT
jgi:mycofactocin glycosyltransferase